MSCLINKVLLMLFYVICRVTAIFARMIAYVSLIHGMLLVAACLCCHLQH